jgi:hypothetical protein
MSLSKFKPVLPTEMDEALEELYAEIDRTYGIPSSANAVSSTSTSSKRSYAQPDNSASKFKKLDEATQMTDLEAFEAELFAEYISPDNDQVQPEDVADDFVNDGTSTDSGEEDVDDDDTGGAEPTPSCEPCSSPKKFFKSSDNDLKNYAFNIPRMFIGKCNSECKFGGNCVEATTIKDMKSMVIDFWDEYDCPAPSAATRRLKLISILSKARNANDNQFHFYAGCKDHDNREVCEAAFLILLGISNSSHASKAPGQWKRVKTYIKEGKDLSGIKYHASEEKLLKAENKSNKFQSASTFIQYFAREFGDTIPGSEGKK